MATNAWFANFRVMSVTHSGMDVGRHLYQDHLAPSSSKGMVVSVQYSEGAVSSRKEAEMIVG